MEETSKVKIIPAKPKVRDKKVAIYARVSSSSSDQLKSLQAQVSRLTHLVAANPTCLLVDDCSSRKIDIVITKSISRFGRDCEVKRCGYFRNLWT